MKLAIVSKLASMFQHQDSKQLSQYQTSMATILITDMTTQSEEVRKETQIHY